MQHCGLCLIKPTYLQLMSLCTGGLRKDLICLCVSESMSSSFTPGKEVQRTLLGEAGIYLLGLSAVNDGSDSSSLYKRLKFSLAQGSIPQDPLPLWAGD